MKTMLGRLFCVMAVVALLATHPPAHAAGYPESDFAWSLQQIAERAMYGDPKGYTGHGVTSKR